MSEKSRGVAASDHSELHFAQLPDHVLIPRWISDNDLAHRNQTNASCDAQIRRTMSSAASSSRRLRSPLAHGRTKDGGFVVKSSCPDQLKNGRWRWRKRTRAACHPRRFHGCRTLPAFLSGTGTPRSAGDFVAVGRKPVQRCRCREYYFTKIRIGVARVRDEVRCSR